MKKILIFIVLYFSLIFNVNALDIKSNNAVLYNLNDDTIVFSKNAHEITKIASLTKIMTTIVAIENIEDLNKTVTMTSDMFKGLYEENAYQIGLRVGDVVTYKDLLYATFIASGADATRGLTLSLTNSEEEFVKLMNDKANEIGLTNTYFTNPIGLDEDGQKSTVDDVAKLLKYALKNETFKNIINTKSYQINNLTVYSSLHKTGDYYNIDTSFITGGKTGYTLEAGRCLASIATDTENNINYLLVTTNASNTPDHILDAHDIYKYYFQNYKYHTILKKGTDLVDIKVIDSNIKNIKFKAQKNITKYLDNTFNINNVKIKYDGLDILSYKNKKGEKVGTIKLIYNNEVIDKFDIILDTEIKFNLFVYIFANSLRRRIFFGFVLLIIFIVIIRRKKTTN